MQKQQQQQQQQQHKLLPSTTAGFDYQHSIWDASGALTISTNGSVD
jgi:outer membrane protein TolC